MKIVADESVDNQIVARLRANGHEVLYVAELDPGIEDEQVLVLSRQANAILLTAVKISVSSFSGSSCFTAEYCSSVSLASRRTRRPSW